MSHETTASHAAVAGPVGRRAILLAVRLPRHLLYGGQLRRWKRWPIFVDARENGDRDSNHGYRPQTTKGVNVVVRFAAHPDLKPLGRRAHSLTGIRMTRRPRRLSYDNLSSTALEITRRASAERAAKIARLRALRLERDATLKRESK